MNLPLSISVCSTRPISTIALLHSLLPQLSTQDELIVIFDIKIGPEIKKLFSSYFVDPLKFYYNSETQGLSFCRNLAMSIAQNRYLIFFDDDVITPEFTIAQYRHFFSLGHNIVGGPLKLPSFYPSLPSWFPTGYSSLLGIHTLQKKVWGANFGFNLILAQQHHLHFQDNLGRKVGQLQSGDETAFFKEYSLYENAPLFIDSLFVYHCIDLTRFKISYLLRRAYWQGRSEVRKNTIQEGFKKELLRALTVDSSSSIISFKQRVVGILLFLSCTVGILTEVTRKLGLGISSFLRLKKRWQNIANL